MSENSVGAISAGGVNSLYNEYSPIDVDAKAARKKWVNNQIQNFFNPPQNTLPPAYDYFAPKGGDGTAAFYG